MNSEKSLRLARTDGRTKRVHVDMHVIRSNKKAPGEQAWQPPITVQTSGGPIKCWGAKGDGWEMKYRPTKPLPCGATVWVETDEAIEVIL